MDYRVAGVLALTVFLVGGAAFSLSGIDEPSSTNKSWTAQVQDQEPLKATFAGGCFWCIEAAFEDIKGVKSAVSGYAGGKKSTATYNQVKTGKTDHREAVQVEYYSSVISYEELLDIYWQSIDPTDPGGQFSDRGPHYTTAIYAHSSKQYRLASGSRAELNNSERFEEPVVTEIENFTTFFRAEDYHQNYSKKRTAQYKIYERASGRKGFVERVWEKSPLS